MGRNVIELPESDFAAGVANDLDGHPPRREAAVWGLPQGNPAQPEGNEAVRTAAGAVQDAPQIRHHDQAQIEQKAGKLTPAGRLMRRNRRSLHTPTHSRDGQKTLELKSQDVPPLEMENRDVHDSRANRGRPVLRPDCQVCLGFGPYFGVPPISGQGDWSRAWESVAASVSRLLQGSSPPPVTETGPRHDGPLKVKGHDDTS